MPKTATVAVPAAPSHAVMYVRVEVTTHRNIHAIAQATGLKLTTVAAAILGQTLGMPTQHSRAVVKAIALARKGG